MCDGKKSGGGAGAEDDISGDDKGMLGQKLDVGRVVSGLLLLVVLPVLV